jgi:hypothetical protein
VLKTLQVQYRVGSKILSARATDPETIALDLPAEPVPPVKLTAASVGDLAAESTAAGTFLATTRSGSTIRLLMPAPPLPIDVAGPWHVRFDTTGTSMFASLTSWSDNPNPSIKYYSGTAQYTATLDVPDGYLGNSRRLYLDLGKVFVMARVTLNGKNLGTLWKEPYRLDVTEWLKPGKNTLAIDVVNLWPNRMIGDERLADDSERNPDGTLRAIPLWAQQGDPSPTGRKTFTTWRLWRKDEQLLPSGLLGPVRLFCTETAPLRPQPGMARAVR